MNYHDDKPENPELLPVGTRVTVEGVIMGVGNEVNTAPYLIKVDTGDDFRVTCWFKADKVTEIK